jgi:hypothetical protein
MHILALGLTGMDVADDAIKIGLSGAIGAVASYLMLRKSQKHEFNRVLFDRRQAIIAKASDDFEQIHSLTRDSLLDYPHNLHVISVIGGPKNPEVFAQTQNMADRIGEASRSIQLVEAKLLLINEVSARRLMAEYRLMLPKAQRIVASAATDNPLPVESANALRKELFDKRNAIYADLAKIFGTPDRTQTAASEEAP